MLSNSLSYIKNFNPIILRDNIKLIKKMKL